jgi:Lrp/AsnC family transcriptional regulator, leucine-responsive regulatory protein
MKLDARDRKLLRAMQRNARQTHAALGRKVHLSASSVRRRLEALRGQGAIRAEVALLDQAAFPPMVSILVLVAFARESTRVYAEFQRRMRADPSVLQCYSIAGEYDFALLAQAPDAAAFEKWSHKHLLADGNIKRYSSFVVWSTVKQELQPMLPLVASD